jgi:hypothetical protein
MTGLIESGLISLTQWVPFVHRRAVYAQSSVRRFARWLANERIDVHQIYGPYAAYPACRAALCPAHLPGSIYMAAAGVPNGRAQAGRLKCAMKQFLAIITLG